jgi:hypothetical protein
MLTFYRTTIIHYYEGDDLDDYFHTSGIPGNSTNRRNTSWTVHFEHWEADLLIEASTDFRIISGKWI